MRAQGQGAAAGGVVKRFSLSHIAARVGTQICAPKPARLRRIRIVVSFVLGDVISMSEHEAGISREI
jgi:hypothetical protein